MRFALDLSPTAPNSITDGTTHQWALDNGAGIQTTVQDAYFAMYALNVAFIFIFIPMSYFYYEEKDEENGTTTCGRIWAGVKCALAGGSRRPSVAVPHHRLLPPSPMFPRHVGSLGAP